ncbi:MAG: ABC-2 family transporter protein [Chloroflexi bacterium]|nr:ABC-2 family transporter protein [Chloroflexota bacterium]
MRRKYLALLRANWQGILEYRAQIIIWMLISTSPLISLAVWLAVAADGPVGGYSSADFVAYYLLAIFVRHMNGSWVYHELEYGIREGLLSPKLLKPLNPIHDYLTTHLGDRIFRLPILIVPLGIIAWLAGAQYDLSPASLALFVLALMLSFGINFLTSYCIGLLNFWITHADSINELEYAFRSLLGGIVAPIALFPAPIPQLSLYLPFRYTLSFPVEILLGRVSPDEMLLGFTVQAAWLALFLGLYAVLWRQGLQAYSAVGA